MNRASVLGASLAPEVQEVMRFRADAVTNLEAQVNRLGIFLTEMAERNSEAVRSLTTDLQRQYQEKQTESEKRFRVQQDEVDAQRKAFEAEKALFDDRQRTHVRRDLLTKIQANIGERAKATPLSREARLGRLWVHIISWIFMVGSAYGMYTAGGHLYAAAGISPFDWRMVPPFTASALVFGATVVFYIRWTSRWADQLVHSDLSLDQYTNDIYRASWVAELLFEYKDEQQKELPVEVLSHLLDGLFKRDGFKGQQYHPSDDLSGFMRGVRRVKAGPEGVEISGGARGK